MPSNTFFNLPDEKRSKLLSAAVQEFRRVPFNDSSINKIIQAAEIPRGSFYTYFADKEDLLLYLLNCYWNDLFRLGVQHLREHDGDVFSLFYYMFECLRPDLPDEKRDPLVMELFDIMRINASVFPSVFGHFQKSDAEDRALQELLPLIDTSELRMDQPRDLIAILRVLFAQTIMAISDYLSERCTASQARLELETDFELLRRGILQPAS